MKPRARVMPGEPDRRTPVGAAEAADH